MVSVIKRNPVSVVLALLLHGLILFFLIFGMDWSNPGKPATLKANVVQAHTVDAKQLNQTKEKERAAEREKQRQQERKRKQTEKKKRQQQLEQKRVAKEKAEKKRQEVEVKRQAQLKKEQQVKEVKRKAETKHKAEMETKRKAEIERKQKAEREAKRKAKTKLKAAVETKKKAEGAARAERERVLQEQMAAEQNSREIDRYVAVIKQQVERNWLKPGQGSEELSCVVQVRLIPGGDVVLGGVSIIRSSGNAAFDRSVESAVYKAAPLPVPSGLLFESFRTLKLNFKLSK
ncbi:MAG: cell envelope integrity protein TolA [Candidatus Thiodiazotropha sp. (ex Lucinoma aequizonata)]|nr:cell envelope integrity protein TolA [Candidatus Thiodiazotropha sp. (ex Lucinoma aequizonata)]MCU7889262.1 cell envelope integrity protein TolA [Candidatus Thiodiazotropha sp. (ex Lucinoma aequizonata)]MCU7893696.1 cell envelope integrity protein TolA [Candidatus Thiodiazotropha sp. (ex Lucinoma aequizonata)]MCU7899655.1 cell envelope integrity protein TolA [Candidatus Thiodiazotropha sp. (ex Lucinoma aequizonata)]MCU7900598.1 cell envelope integrity protein TolA [Candidatus Thiodiazotropha